MLMHWLARLADMRLVDRAVGSIEYNSVRLRSEVDAVLKKRRVPRFDHFHH
jgi:hypothetical protein